MQHKNYKSVETACFPSMKITDKMSILVLNGILKNSPAMSIITQSFSPFHTVSLRNHIG